MPSRWRQMSLCGMVTMRNRQSRRASRLADTTGRAGNQRGISSAAENTAPMRREMINPVATASIGLAWHGRRIDNDGQHLLTPLRRRAAWGGICVGQRRRVSR